MRLTTFITCLLISSHAWASDFKIISSDMNAGKELQHKQIYQGFGCNGANISPQLSWHNAPANTKSFAVTVYDPDAPTGSGWWHWVIVNIPASVTQISADAGNIKNKTAPQGSLQIRTDFGNPGYGGACPPAGDKAHRYQFKVFALDIEKLDLTSDSTAALAGFYLHAHALDTAVLEVFYAR